MRGAKEDLTKPMFCVNLFTACGANLMKGCFSGLSLIFMLRRKMLIEKSRRD